MTNRKPIFVCTSDEHIWHTTPVSRSDDYLKACGEKLKFITEKANELNVPWLSAGDLFDKPANLTKASMLPGETMMRFSTTKQL